MNKFHNLAAQPAAPLKKLSIGLLIISFLALSLAPLNMPASYSWLRHTTSESAAQGIEGAWLARLGFLLFGLTVLWLSERLIDEWPPLVRLLHGVWAVYGRNGCVLYTTLAAQFPI